MAEDAQDRYILELLQNSPPEIAAPPPQEQQEIGLASLISGAKEKAGDLWERYKKFSYPPLPDAEPERKLPVDIVPPAEKPDVGYNPNWRENPTIKSIIENDPIIERIIMAESSGDINAKSDDGARGLMQIMPSTSENEVGFGVNYTLDRNELWNPVKNVQFGSDYFKGLRKYYGNNKDALIAYNWGHGNYQSFRDLGYWIEKKGDKEIIHKTLPKETRDYVTKILGKEKHTGGMIQRNPYPYNARPI